MVYGVVVQTEFQAMAIIGLTCLLAAIIGLLDERKSANAELRRQAETISDLTKRLKDRAYPPEIMAMLINERFAVYAEVEQFCRSRLVARDRAQGPSDKTI